MRPSTRTLPFLPLLASLAILSSCSSDEIQGPILIADSDSLSAPESSRKIPETGVDLLASQSEVDGSVGSDGGEVEIDAESDETDIQKIDVMPACVSKADCEDNDVCTDDGCNFALGVCVHAIKLFFSCNDGNACTQDDRCQQDGTCLGETKTPCVDGNSCTLDFCDKKDGCQFVAVDGACNDGNACTQNDQCKSGICSGTFIVCDDKEPCTTDSCNPKTGCVFEKQNNIPCSDNNACTSGDLCVSGVCKGFLVDCADGNSCTVDHCDQQTGCYSTPAPNNTPCSDGDGCTLKDACVDSVCKPGSKKPCDDNNVCTADSCNPADGSCIHTILPGIHYCDDNNACTFADVCTLGFCVGKIVQCYDANDCTLDTCDAKIGCQYIAQDKAPCDDGDKCTLGDICVKDVCTGKPIVCNDSNQCTTDTCDPFVGKCNFTANNGFYCNDGNACTIGDVCEGTVCTGKTLACTDGNPCTDDSCNPKTGCFFTPTPNAPCNDENLCTKDDICLQSVCTGKPIKCDDGNPCTVDSCDKLTGLCLFAPYKDGNACNDGDACTLGDTCQGGKCAGIINDCDDKNPCTKDACVPQTGKCTYTAIPGCPP